MVLKPRIFWKTWHPHHPTTLCDCKYILAQPVRHTFIGKGLQWPYSLKWPIYMSSTLLDVCFWKRRTATNQSPMSGLLEDTAAPPLGPTPSVYVKLPQKVWVVSAFSPGAGIRFSEGNFLVFISRSQFYWRCCCCCSGWNNWFNLI